MKKKETLILLIILLVNFVVVLTKISFFRLYWSHETCILYTIAKELESGKVYNFQSIIPSYKYLSSMFFILLNIPLYKIFHSFLHSSVALSILITSSIVIINYIFLKKIFNFKIALIGSILFFSTEWGSLFLARPWIFLTDFFCFLTFVVAYYLYFEKRNYFTHFLLGILAGISFSFHPLGIFILIFSFLVQFKTIRFDSINLKKFLIFLSALLIIFIPYLIFTDIKSFYISILTNESLDGLSRAFVGHDRVGIPENIFKRAVQISPTFFLLPFLYLSLENIFRFAKRKKLDKEFLLLIYTGGIFLFGLFTYINHVYILAVLTIPTISLIAIFLGKFVEKYRKYGMICAIIFVIFIFLYDFFLYDLHTYPLDFSPIPEFYKECYDVFGYAIAKTYNGTVDGFTRDCDKLEENRYYCYKGLGKVIGREAISLNNLTLSKCNEVEFNQWCKEGLLEELSFHLLRNLSLENERDVYYFEEGKWSLINLNIDESRQKFIDLKINLSVCEEFPNKELCYENLPWIYLMTKENLMTKKDMESNLLKELVSTRECNGLEEPHRIYCYVGWFKKINPEGFPYIGSLDTCYLWGGECKYACFLSLSMKINFRFPDVKIAERICKIVGGEDKIFKEICYSTIGFSSANRFYYNTSKAFEECTKIKENRENCFSGVSYFIEEKDYYQILHNIVGKEELGTCKMQGLWHLREISDFYLKDLTLTDTTIHIESSSNIYLKNLTLDNTTIRVDRSSEIHLDNSNLVNSSVVIEKSSNSSVSGLALSNSNVLIYRSSEIHLDNSNLVNSSAMVYDSSSISIENSEINNSSFLARESSIALYNTNIIDASIWLDRSSDSSIKNLSLFNTSFIINRVSNINLSDMELSSASLQIKGSSDVSITKSVIKDYTRMGEYYYRSSKENGVHISNSKNVLLHSSKISNFKVNIFIENSKNISIENSTLNNAIFRNFYGKCVSNLNIDNSIFKNVSNDMSIDFSECHSQNVVIKNSKISDSQKGVRLNNIENITIENNEIGNGRVGIKIGKVVSLVNIRNNLLNNFEYQCVLIHKSSLPNVKLENNTMKNCGKVGVDIEYETVE